MRNITQILCPVDLSDTTRHAASYAAHLARWYSAKITALHIANSMQIANADFAIVDPESLPGLNEDEAKAVRERILNEFGAAGAAGVDVVVETGLPAARIVDFARRLPADLVVMGTHGAGGFQHLVLGSVTEKVLRQATCPVLTVPPRARTTAALPFRRLLCPVDFSESAVAALDFASSLASEGDAALTILHVFEWPHEGEALNYRPINVPEFQRQVEQDAADRLRELASRPGHTAQSSTRVAHGKAYREVLEVAAEEGSDLIVMGVQGRNALDLMLFGSTTNQVIRRATCPVLTVRR
jgi:nucleotide-binding universal stress UspA family protein